MTERKPREEHWESFVERQIREAQESGQFDHLPGLGKPLEDLGDPHDELWWVKKKMRRERLSLLPPSLEIRLDVERTLQAVTRLGTEADVRRTIERLNDRIRRANLTSVWGPPSTTMPVDVELVVEQWRRARGEAESNS